MLRVEASDFYTDAVRNDLRAADGRETGGDAFAAVLDNLRSKKPAARTRVREGPEGLPAGDVDDKEDLQENPSLAAAVLAVPDMPAESPGGTTAPEGGEIDFILEGISLHMDGAPAAEAGDTARMPETQETIPLPAEDGPAHAGAAGRFSELKNEDPCPLENGNDEAVKTISAPGEPTQDLKPAEGTKVPDGAAARTDAAEAGEPEKPEPQKAEGGEERAARTEVSGAEASPRRTGAAKEDEPAKEFSPEKPKTAEGKGPVDIAPERLEAEAGFAAEVQKTTRPVRVSELFDTMVERMELSMGAEGKVMVVQLRPEFLGRVQLQLSMTETGLSAKILTEDVSVRGLIQSQIGRLVETLSDRGIKVGEVEVLYAGTAGGEAESFQGGHGARNGGGTKRRIAGAGLRLAAEPYGAALPEIDWYGSESSVEYTA